MLGSTKRRHTGAISVAPASSQDVARSIADIMAAIPQAPVRGLIADSNVTHLLDAATNCGGRVLKVGGALADTAVTSVDWEQRTAWANGAASVADVTRDLLVQGWVPERLAGPSYLTMAGLISLGLVGPYAQRTSDHQTLPQRVYFVDGLGQRRQVERTGDDATNLSAIYGTLGLTGIVTAVQIAIRPVSSGWMLVDSTRCESFDSVITHLVDAPVGSYSYARLDPSGHAEATGRGIVVTGRHARVLELPEIRQPDALEYVPSGISPARTRRIPVGRWTQATQRRSFQDLSFRASAQLRRDQLVPLPSFFHDVAEARLETKRRFATISYEFSVPFREVDLVREFLRDTGVIGCTADHATIQRTVSRAIGPLLPSIDGWTFAIELGCDVPGVGALLDSWDERIASVGGFVHLASDSRLRPDLVTAMYPRLDRWHGLRDQLDPGRHFCSDLSRRLDL